MLHVFFDVVLPVALVAIAGGAVGRWRRIPLSPISTLVFYLLGPALVFHSLATTQLSAGVSARIVVVMLATFVAMYVAATAWSLIARHDPSMRAAFALAATTLAFVYTKAPHCCKLETPGVRLAAAGVLFYAAAWVWLRLKGPGRELWWALLLAGGAHVGFLAGGLIRYGTVCPLCAATAGACLVLNVVCGHRAKMWGVIFGPAVAAGALLVWKVMP